jgi:hypothetical protein
MRQNKLNVSQTRKLVGLVALEKDVLLFCTSTSGGKYSNKYCLTPGGKLSQITYGGA